LDKEQVDIEKLSLASISKRTKAFIIDDLLITFLVMILLWDSIMQSNGDMVAIMEVLNGAFIQVVALKFLYQTFFIWYYGATIGKMVAKIKVIDYNSFGKVDIIKSSIRSLGRILSESFFYLGFLFAYYSESKQTFHDKLGGTLVVDV